MTPYFQNNQKWEEFLARMKEWEGTPYRHLTMVKGRGADCTLLIGSLFTEIDLLKKVEYDYYPKDWHMTTTDERVLEGIVKHITENKREDISIERFSADSGEELYRGDIIAFNFPRIGVNVSHHASIYCGTVDGRRNLMFNAMNQRGCCFCQYGSHWQRRLTTIFRIME